MPETIIVTEYLVETVEVVVSGGGGGATTLDGLFDVTFTTLANKNILQYNGTQWVNASLQWSDLNGVPSTFTPATHNQAWSTITSTPTTLAGYGITDPVVLTSSSYANPSWITSLAWGKLTGVPSTFTPSAHTHVATEVSDSTVTGRSLLTAVDAAAARSAISAAAVSHTQAWSTITSTPTTLAGYGITDPVVITSGSYANPSWITSLAWSKLTGVPLTFAPTAHTHVATEVSDSTVIGRSVLTAVDAAAVRSAISAAAASHTQAWSTITSTPTTLAGYGITDSVVVTSGSYANPSWITSLAWSKLTGVPGTFPPDPHNLLSHTGSGLTAGHVLAATGATTFDFTAITAAMLPSDVARTSISNTFSSIQTMSGVVITNNGALELREQVANGTHAVRHTAAASLAATTTYVWPGGSALASPPSVYLLANDNGQLSWYSTPPKWHYDRVHREVVLETPNGSTLLFTFGTVGPNVRTIVPSSVVVYLNGILQDSTEVTVDEGNNTVLFVVAPAVGDVVMVDYNYEGVTS